MLEFGVGFEFSGLQDIISAAQLAESKGFQSCWIAEDYYFRGAISIASAVAARTQSIRVGTGVINPYTRHPVLIAMEMQALDELSCGRAFVGLGASEKFWMEEQLHIQYGSSRRSLRECVEILRGVWQGKEFSYSGAAFQVSGVKLQIHPLRSSIPVYLGVVRQGNLELAGQIADGLLLALMSNPPYVNFAVEKARRGAESVGRDLQDFPVYTYVLLSVDEDRTLARMRVRPLLAKYVGYLKDHPVLTCTGHTNAEIQPFVDALRTGKDCTDLVADWMVDAFAVAGLPSECRSKLQTLAEAGVTGFVIFEVPGIPVMDTVSSVAKYILPAFQ